MITSDFIEKLEVLVWEKKKCEIIFSDGKGKVIISGLIEGVHETEDLLVLQMQSGQIIQLDTVVSVNGIEVEKFC